jgi:Sec-independent protein translocase protein TatA
MKKRAFVVVVALVLSAVGVPAFASHCPTLIKEANEKMASMDQNSDKVKKAKDLVAEADRLHKSGSHDASVKKGEEALATLK